MVNEQRHSKGTAEVRAGQTGPMIVGYAATSGLATLQSEQIDPGAFTKTISEADVRALGNHDADWLLGRMKAGTLRMASDATGLRYEIDVNESDPDGQRALAKVRRGDWDGSSFSYRAIRDEWDWSAEPRRRRLLEAALIDVGPVTFPAYPDSSAAARALAPIAAKTGRSIDELVEGMRSGEIRSMIELPVLTTGGDEPPEPDPPPEVNPLDGLTITDGRKLLRGGATETRALVDMDGDPANVEQMVGAVVAAYHAKLDELGLTPGDDGFMLCMLADQDGDQDGDGQTLWSLCDDTALFYVLADGGEASVIAFQVFGWASGYWRSTSVEAEHRFSLTTLDAILTTRTRSLEQLRTG